LKNKGLLVITLTGLAVVTFVIGAREIRARHYDAAFSQVAVGDPDTLVVARMGAPALRENAGQPYLRYATSGCSNPCVVRLWWEMPIMPGIEGWSVELGKDHKVVRTSHWVSP
jgi:hypothetical protein